MLFAQFSFGQLGVPLTTEHNTALSQLGNLFSVALRAEIKYTTMRIQRNDKHVGSVKAPRWNERCVCMGQLYILDQLLSMP